MRLVAVPLALLCDRNLEACPSMMFLGNAMNFSQWRRQTVSCISRTGLGNVIMPGDRGGFHHQWQSFSSKRKEFLHSMYGAWRFDGVRADAGARNICITEGVEEP